MSNFVEPIFFHAKTSSYLHILKATSWPFLLYKVIEGIMPPLALPVATFPE